MDAMKQQIRNRLVANYLMDICAQCKGVVFRDAWCTQDRVIRFTTDFFRTFFGVKESEKGKWKTGDAVMYEADNTSRPLVVNCVLNKGSVPYQHTGDLTAMLKAADADVEEKTMDVVLEHWELDGNGDDNQLFDEFRELLEKAIPAFEKELDKKIQESKRTAVVMHEGEEEYVISHRYERDPKARAACIAAHGTTCAVCGMDFAKEYGPSFAGKIEVHHIVPLSEIGEDYVVDPVKDLVPVCPNCHTALHSKPNGVYTVEELKRIRKGLE